MALKGSILKKEVTDKILSVFEGSFLYNEGKEIRIPGLEDGQELQIKVSLTCAKTNVNAEEENSIPGKEIVLTKESSSTTSDNSIQEISQEEKQNIKKMMEALGL